MSKENKLLEIKHLECLNCGCPFFGNEAYCPECGQKNKSNKITFRSFLQEIFNGFTSWDAKFWKTLIPLLTQPGKISKDYIQGKRARYTNPFRFYLTTSIVFFLLIGLTDAIKNYQEFSAGTSEVKKSENISLSGVRISKTSPEIKNVNISKAAFFGVNVMEFVNFQKQYPKLSIHQALDSLQKPKTFANKLFYKKAATINNFATNPYDSINGLIKETTSYFSTAIFMLLPIFALFLKLMYFRRGFTYVEHLVFVFHTQTVLPISLILFHLLDSLFSLSSSLLINMGIGLFLIYFFVAMKRFYEQSYLKTTVKFLLTVAIQFFTTLLLVGALVTLAFVLM